MAESVARQRINWRVLGVEAAAIFFSVMLGFGVTEWREARADARERHDALLAFSLEIDANRDELIEHGAYHYYVASQITLGLQEGTVQTVPDVFQEIEGVNSFSPVDLSNTAWRTANATGAIGNIEFDIATSLSRVYDDLDALENEQTRIREIGLEALGAPTPQPIARFSVLLNEFVGMEFGLLVAMDSARVKLADALGQPTPQPTPEDALLTYSPSTSVAASDDEP
ncbi:MAG: hypothetical protein AAF170_10490 [Bacteroidota bacterium]